MRDAARLREESMRHTNPATLLIACAVLVLTVCSPVATPQALAAPEPPRSAAASSLATLGTLTANVYLQTSAEYRACCYCIYSCAASRLEAILGDADPSPERPAVVMDLDETVIDCASFQTFLYKNGLEHSDELWADFERNHWDEVGLIAGAKAFIEKAEALGVTVIYLSNRTEANREWTARALERLGINVTEPPSRLYLRPENASSDKSPRREQIAAKYNVLMYVGDNLRDFSETFVAAKLPADAAPEDRLVAIEERALLTDLAACHWGVDWFVLPNPAYGEWQKLVGPEPEAILRPTSMALPRSE
jgi:5'-nucleotidase (lipoprotein e(P4) family)